MGNVNCCEQPKEGYNHEIETHLTSQDNQEDKPFNDLSSVNQSFKAALKPKQHYDAKTQRIIKIQSIAKRFLTKSKFIKKVTLHRLALKEFFRTQGVLCEKDDIDAYVNPYVRSIESQIKNREGVYNNPNIPRNLFQDISYQPFYSIEMPCTYLVENNNKDDINSYNNYHGRDTVTPMNNKISIINQEKDMGNCPTNNPSDNESALNSIKKPVYKGHWSIDKKKNGYGIFVNSDGSKYEGLFRNGKLDGKGRYITVKGDFFEGNFSNGYASGYGIFIHSDGSIYKGNWMNDLPWGDGEEWTSDGAYYKGDFFQGKKFGVGEFNWKDGSMYLGGVKNDLLNGEGIYSWNDGKRYKGFWLSNNMHGKGVLENPDGSKYEGSFVNSKKEGKGKYWYNKDKYYEGEWKNGKQHGKGKIVKNGVVEEGEWLEGKKIKI